jgi:hypothetical protein
VRRRPGGGGPSAWEPPDDDGGAAAERRQAQGGGRWPAERVGAAADGVGGTRARTGGGGPRCHGVKVKGEGRRRRGLQSV